MHELATPSVEATTPKSKPKELVVAPPIEANVNEIEAKTSAPKEPVIAAPVIPKEVTLAVLGCGLVVVVLAMAYESTGCGSVDRRPLLLC